MTKSDLRRQIRQMKAAMTTEEREAWSDGVARHVIATKAWREADTVLLYYALPDEVSTAWLTGAAITEGKLVLLPRVTGEGTMELRRYTGPDDLRRGAYGIMEPTGEVYPLPENIPLAIVPGMAFDRHGHRLGRGKGYYDRLLATMSDTYKIGIAFPYQLLDNVPAEDSDVAMDEVITAE